MGDLRVELAAGDLLVVDNLKLHNVEDLPGLDTWVIVMSFMPDSFTHQVHQPAITHFCCRFVRSAKGMPTCCAPPRNWPRQSVRR